MCRIGGRGRCCVSDVAGRDVAGRDVAGRDVAGRDVADRDVADRDVADRDVADRDVADRDVADRRLWPIVACRALPTGSRGPVLHAGCCGLRSAAGLRCEGERMATIVEGLTAAQCWTCDRFYGLFFETVSLEMGNRIPKLRPPLGNPDTEKSVHGGWRAIGWGCMRKLLAYAEAAESGMAFKPSKPRSRRCSNRVPEWWTRQSM